MATPVTSILEHNSVSSASIDGNEVRGAIRTSVAGLDDLATIPLDRVKPYATLVYVDGQGEWYYNISDANATTGAATSVAEDTDWVVFAPGGSQLVIQDDDGDANVGSTVKFITGDYGIETDYSEVGEDTTPTVANLDIKLKNVGSLTDKTIMAWDGTAGNYNLVNSVLVDDGSGNISVNSGAGNLTCNTLNVTTINAANTYTSASISTSDTFLRLADPTGDFADAGDGITQTEYANAQHAGFVINTGYYDDNADEEAGMQFSTHKLLYWNKTLLKWVVQDGTPERDDTTDPDTLINAENDYSESVGRLAGTMKFVENFYIPDAAALHFGLDSVFAYDHFDDTNDPSITSTTDEFMKTQWVIDRKVLFEWANFNLADADISGGANEHLTDVTWTDTGSDDAANEMANTYIRTGRVLKAKVVLEGDDLSVSGSEASIKVYHGGIFDDEIPMVRVYRKISGTEGSDAEYEEIMVRTKITDSTAYIEIIFNVGYLQTSAGEGNILYVRMVG